MARSEKSYHLIYFLLQPFFTLLYYLKNFKKPHAKNVMWLFTIFYGFTFAIGVESEGNDIVSYVAQVPLLNRMNLDWNGFLTYYVTSGEADILRVLLSYIVSLFTANGFYLVIIFGVIYGYFFSRNMWYILDRLEGKTKFFTKILILCLFLVIPVWNLNGFRFWTAAHVFLYGLLPFLFEGKRKSLVWCVITPFVVHFSFLITLVPICVYFILGNKLKLYYIFFVISLFVSEININTFNNVMKTYAPETMIQKTKYYTTEAKVDALREGEVGTSNNAVWYAKYYKLSLKFSLIAFLLVFYWVFRKTINSNKDLLKLLSFILLFYSFANVLSSIPSGGRFISIASLLTIAFLTLYLQNNKVHKDLYRLSKLTVPFLIFFIIISIRTSWFSLSIMTIIGNPLTAIFTFGDNIALNDIIKSF